MELTSFEYICKGKQFVLNKRVDLAIVCFESAISKGIIDNELLMEVQNELGNVYLSIEDYEKAINIHKKNLNLAQKLNNYSMESVSYANITLGLTSLCKYKDATYYCLTHLEFSKQLGKGLDIVQALFNLGSIYYYQAKTEGALIPNGPFQLPEEIENYLETSTEYFKSALLENKVVKDGVLEMKILGNYSNVRYLLSDFKKSIKLNTRKLKLAIELNDKESEKRSYLNRGNCYVHLKNYKCAIKDYKSALEIVRISQEVNSEINLLYTLSDTFCLSGNFQSAVDCMIKYRNLVIAKNNKQCESRANLCLCIIYSALEDYDMSEVYAKNHLITSVELKNNWDCVIANENLRKIEEMKTYLEHKKYKLSPSWIVLSNRRKPLTSVNLPDFLEFKDLTELQTKIDEAKRLDDNGDDGDDGDDDHDDIESSTRFFQKIYRFQFEKMKNKNVNVDLEQLKNQFIDYISSSKKIFLNSLANLQGNRMNDQRTILPAYR